MKKIVIILGMSISSILILLGVFGLLIDKNIISIFNSNKVNDIQNDISSENTLTVLSNSLQKLKTANSLTSTLSVDTNKDDEDTVLFTKMNFDTKEVEMNMSVQNVEAIHLYSVVEDGLLVDYTYMPMLGFTNWIKSNGENSTYDSDLSYIDLILGNINSFTVNDNIFTAVVSKEVGEQIYSNSNQYEKLNSTATTSSVIGNVIVTIRLENNRVKNMIFDFSNSIKNNDEVYPTFIVSQLFSDIGNTKVAVPGEVKTQIIETN